MAVFSLSNIPTPGSNLLVEGALSNLKSSWLSSPAMEFPPHEAGKGQQGLQYSQHASLRLSLHAMSGGCMEEVRHHLLTTVTQDLDLAMGSWRQDVKCWSLASHEKKILWELRERELCVISCRSLECSYPTCTKMGMEDVVFVQTPQILTILTDFFAAFLEQMLLHLLFALRTISRDLLFSKYFSPVSLGSGQWSSSNCHCWKSVSTEEF